MLCRPVAMLMVQVFLTHTGSFIFMVYMVYVLKFKKETFTMTIELELLHGECIHLVNKPTSVKYPHSQTS